MAVAKCPKCKTRRLEMGLAAPLEADITRKGDEITVALTGSPQVYLWCAVCRWTVRATIKGDEMVIEDTEPD